MPSKVRGIISTRRLLKRIPDAARAELTDAMRAAGPELAGKMLAKAPRGQTGNLQAALQPGYKFYEKTLRLVVGLIGRRLNSKLFYARILEFGRKAQTVNVTRNRTTNGTGRVYRRGGQTRVVGSTYMMRVKALAARRFIYQPATQPRVVLSRRLNGIWDRVLRRVAETGDE